MKIAVLSDIHDHVWHLAAALRSEAMSECEALICCGDLCSPFVLAMLGKGFAGPIHVVFGNNDGDTFRITSIAKDRYSDRITLHGEYAHISLGGAHIAVNHFDGIAGDLARAGTHDWVFFGHDHRMRLEVFEVNGRVVRLLNPGAIMGAALGPEGPYRVAHSFCVVDIQAGSVKGFQVDSGAENVTFLDVPIVGS